MTIQIILQGFFFLFAFVSAYEEEAFTFPFREIYFDPQTKFRKLKKAHRAGASGVFFMMAMAGIMAGMQFDGPANLKIIVGIMTCVVCGLWYWLTFDPVYAKNIGQDLFYLGGTAGTDGRLKKMLGKNPGLKKALFCVVVIIAINLVYGLLLY